MLLCNDEAAAQAGRRAIAIGTAIQSLREKLCNPDTSIIERRLVELARLHAVESTARVWAEELSEEDTTPERRDALLLGLRRLFGVPVNGEITKVLSRRFADQSRLLSRVAAAIDIHASRTFFRNRQRTAPPRWVTPT